MSGRRRAATRLPGQEGSPDGSCHVQMSACAVRMSVHEARVC